MKKVPQLSKEKHIVQPQENINSSIWQQLKNAKLTYATALMMLLSSCGSEPGGEIIEEPNKKPTASIKNVSVDNTANTIQFDIDGIDTDGTIQSYQAKLIKTDGTKVTIHPDSEGVYNQEITTLGDYNKLEYGVNDNDGANSDVKTTSINLQVTAPNVDSTISNPTPTLDENSTNDIDLGINDQNGIDNTDFVDANSELAQMFDIIENTKLRLKTGKTLNHEVDSSITGQIKVIDNLGNEKIFDIIINLNDLQEEQTINVLGDNELLPNGEKYAIKTDEEAAGQTLPIMYYNHGNARRLESVIENEIVNSSTGYGDAQTDIHNLFGTGIGPEYSNGQDMLSFDTSTNEMIIHAEDGSESARIGRSIYGKMMRRIMIRTGINDSVNFVQNGTVLNTVWEDMILLQAKNPNNLYVAVDKAIQNYLGQ